MPNPNNQTTFTSKYGNYYGHFTVCLIDRKPHAAVENHDGYHWEPCSRELYEAVKAEVIAEQLKEVV